MGDFVMDHVCIVCGHVHNEELEGKWNELPDDFTCPECGVGKEDYEDVSF
jgi:rubredoxin